LVDLNQKVQLFRHDEKAGDGKRESGRERREGEGERDERQQGKGERIGLPTESVESTITSTSNETDGECMACAVGCAAKQFEQRR
jgi:hypothetical protein